MELFPKSRRRLIAAVVASVIGALVLAAAPARGAVPAKPATATLASTQDCELLGRLLQAIFTPAEAPARPVHFSWQDCDPSPEPKILTWRVERFLLHDLLIAKAVFHYEYPRLDRTALEQSRRLRVAGAQAAYAEFFVESLALLEYVAREKNSPEGLLVEIADRQLILRFYYKLWRWSMGLTFRGPLMLQGDTVRFELQRLELGGWNLPGFIRRWVEKSINPVFRLELWPWALQPTEIRLSTEPAGVVLIAKERHVSP